jgi:hypothetical protein
MRRLVSLVLPLLLLAAMPLAATAAECPRLVGAAILHVDTSTQTGEGVALVKLGGVAEVVEFDSTAITGPGGELQTIQHWDFNAGNVTLLEHAFPHPIGKYLTINSPVDVVENGSGQLYFLGLYDTTTDIARFAVAGRLCID